MVSIFLQYVLPILVELFQFQFWRLVIHKIGRAPNTNSAISILNVIINQVRVFLSNIQILQMSDVVN